MRDLTIDPLAWTAVVQSGAFNAEVKVAAAEHGLWYPPDPSSFEFCSTGGNGATNAGGLCSVKYGVTADYVLGMKVVLADGTQVQLGGPRIKDVVGLNLTQLFIGSEGTLGVITEVTLRLVPAQRPATTLVATSSELDDSINAISCGHVLAASFHAGIHGQRHHQRGRRPHEDGVRARCRSDAGHPVR